jgi:hypothetical protein
MLSFSRARLLGGAVVAVIKPPVPVSHVEGLRQLWRVADSEQHSGAAKTARILEKMTAVAVHPTRVRHTRPRSHESGAGGWWENEYEDLMFS